VAAGLKTQEGGKGERIPSVAACRALAWALGCAPRLLVLRAFRATAPAEIQDLLRDEGAVASEDPVWQELAPLVTTVQTLPQGTRQQLVALWQASLKLVQGGSQPPPSPPAEPVSEGAEPYANTPYY
jgi:hypothetical protein